jgi:hypothetical protein
MPSLGLHVLTKAELRPEWLRGQVIGSPEGLAPAEKLRTYLYFCAR